MLRDIVVSLVQKHIKLGCGAGLPGVYCCSCGAKKVDFQDYNEEVLQLLTHTNVHKNISEETVTQCRYFSGDWCSFSQFLQHEKLRYDVILTAETIYSPKNYACLHGVLCEALMDNGIVVLAAKVYYFGVGGSVDGFLEYVKKQKQFTAEIVHTIQAAVPRNIIIFHRQRSSSILK
ncbi:histidine protein methyltransferase 1 homolog [Plakobranchus ocellatus]|uniref:protein-histidine N-methyltransferase n=1 Tax=Plakobranchus ocellatus TaxID=259542 RepID=A0AAV3Z650_9GAST|nr:histidine protein methyltransferase 1 homolog [Plakobranchus ocellatus]